MKTCSKCRKSKKSGGFYSRGAVCKRCKIKIAVGKYWEHKGDDRLRCQKRTYIRKRIANDPIFKMKHRLRAAIHRALKKFNQKKLNSTFEIIGLSGLALHEHLLSGFVTLYNREPSADELLDIDHIIPLKTAKSVEEVLKLNHYTNLRYMLRWDNQVNKGDKINWSLVEVSCGQH